MSTLQSESKLSINKLAFLVCRHTTVLFQDTKPGLIWDMRANSAHAEPVWPHVAFTFFRKFTFHLDSSILKLDNWFMRLV